MNWRVVTKTLGMAVFGGATSGAIAGMASGSFNPEVLGTSVLSGVLVAVSSYLKQSPLPPQEDPPVSQTPPRYKGL